MLYWRLYRAVQDLFNAEDLYEETRDGECMCEILSLKRKIRVILRQIADSQRPKNLRL